MTTMINKLDDNYSVISTYHFYDKNLSWEARGILSYLLSCIKHSQEIHPDSELLNRPAFNELIKQGYIKKMENEFNDVVFHINEVSTF